MQYVEKNSSTEDLLVGNDKVNVRDSVIKVMGEIAYLMDLVERMDGRGFPAAAMIGTYRDMLRMRHKVLAFLFKKADPHEIDFAMQVAEHSHIDIPSLETLH